MIFSATVRHDRRVTSRWDLPRGCASAAILTGLAGEYGVPPEVVLSGTDIRHETLADPDAEITAGQELRLVRNLVHELGDVPALGLEAGSRYHLSTHGLMGFAVLSSRTVREALEVGARYFQLTFTFTDFVITEIGDDLRVVIDDTDTPDEVRPFMVERDVAAVGTLQRDLLGFPLAAKELAVGDIDRGYADRYEEITGNVPTFGAELTTLLVPAEILDLPLPQANPHTAALCERQCAELLQRRMSRLGISGQVRDLLVRRSSTDQDDVARELNTSVRTLRRQLAEEGTSFRELSAEVSCLLAEELLGSGMPVEQVASRLGYSSASSLTHAYRRWRGTTPGAYARASRGRLASRRRDV